MKAMINYGGSVVYRIVNLKTGQCYVGSACRFYYRQCGHISDLRKNKHHSKYLQRSWNKHGEDSFAFEILEQVPIKSQLLQREQYWLDALRPAYNSYPIAGSPLGSKKTPEQIQAMKDRIARFNPHIGSKRSAESRQRMSDAQKKVITPDRIKAMHSARAEKANINGWSKPMAGKHHSEETKLKIGMAIRGERNGFFGRHHSQESIEKARQKIFAWIKKNGGGARKGAVLSEETKRKISMANMGKPGPIMTEDGLRRLRESKLGPNNPNFGKKLSSETRAKMSASKKALYASPEWKNRHR